MSRRDVKPRQPCQAEPGQRQQPHRFAVAYQRISRRRDRSRARPSLSEERPAFDHPGKAEIEAVVAGQCRTGVCGTPCFAEIGRRADHHLSALPRVLRPIRAEFLKRTGADGDVGALPRAGRRRCRSARQSRGTPGTAARKPGASGSRIVRAEGHVALTLMRPAAPRRARPPARQHELAEHPHAALVKPQPSGVSCSRRVERLISRAPSLPPAAPPAC